MINYTDAKGQLTQICTQGAQLRTEAGLHQLAYVDLRQRKDEHSLTLLYQDTQGQWHAESMLVDHFDYDPETAKFYFALDDRRYVKLKPCSTNDLGDWRRSMEQTYLNWTNKDLPRRAAAADWPVVENHCMQRIALDHLFRDCWYQHLDKDSQRPAYRQLNNLQLGRLLFLTYHMMHLPAREARHWNQRSLQWRGKG